MTRWLRTAVCRPAFVPFVGYSLACLWPGLHFLTNNVEEFQWMGRSAVLVVVVVCALLWLAGICCAAAPSLLAARWSVPRAFSVGSVAVFLFFTHEAIQAFLDSAWSIRGLLYRSIYLIVVAATLGVTWRLSRHEPFRTALAIAAALMMTPSIGNLAHVAAAPRTATVNDGDARFEEEEPAGAWSKENVYYVILDEYAGASALEKYAGNDIDGFLRQMHDLGYASMDSARANYITTPVSLMATLESQYILTDSSPRLVNRRGLFPQALQLGHTPQLVRQLQAAGYDFIHIGNIWSPCGPRATLRCLTSASPFGFYRRIANAFLAPTRIPVVVGRLFPDNTQAMDILSAALEDLTRQDQPFFAFVHNLAPHPPYLRADCSGQFADNRRADREQYGSAVACVNRQVLALAARIEALDPDAIVVFQADHGTEFTVDWNLPLREWTGAAIEERTSILNLIHVPEPCRRWLRQTLSPINTMRLVLGCLQRRPPGYLPERTYINTYEENVDFGLAYDVTHRFDELQEASSTLGNRD